MSGNVFVGRSDPVEKLRRFLVGERPHTQRLRLFSIGGPGGVGKTYLLDHVIQTSDLGGRSYLRSDLRGTDERVPTGTLITDDFLTNLEPQHLVDGGYFKRTKRCRAALDAIDERIRAQALDRAGDDSELKGVLAAAFQVGRGIQAISPRLREYVDLDEVDGEVVDAAAELLQQAAREERVFLPFLQRGKHLRNQLRGHHDRTLAEHLSRDLSDFFGDHSTNTGGLDRLLLIIDDYESLLGQLQGFLTEQFLPRLQKGHFDVDVVVIGRDVLTDTGPVWKQSFEPALVAEVCLQALAPSEAREYCTRCGITDKEVIDRIVEETDCYPYLLVSEVQDQLTGGRTALGLKGFVDRTTRWMTADQRKWILRLCFLDAVNLESIEAVLPDADPNSVMDWFMAEASIRSTDSDTWQLRPLIRTRLVKYVQNLSPKQAHHLVKLAAELNE